MLHFNTSVDSNGRPMGDIIAQHIVTDGPTPAEMESDDILYWMGVSFGGSWMIRKETKSAGTERFAFGLGDCVTAWANKTSQTYDRTNIIF